MYGINEDIYGRLNNTKPVENRDPFIGEGKHRLVVLELVPFTHTTHGPSIRCTFEVLTSTSAAHAPGSRVAKLWFLNRPAKFPNQPNDSDRFADFIRKIKGSPDNYQVGGDCATLLRDRLNEQLMRGVVVDALGVNTSKKADKPFVDTRWSNVSQSGDQVRDMRARVEASMSRQAIGAPGTPSMPAAPATVPATSFLAQVPPVEPNKGGWPY